MVVEIESRKCLACRASLVPRFRNDSASHWRCPECGLEEINPQPSDAELAKIYDESYFSHYHQSENPLIVRRMKRATYARHLRQLQKSQIRLEPRRLLDCGAATGFFAELAKEFGWDAFAIELSDFGSQSCAALLGPERVFRGQVQEAGFPANRDCRFELITMFDFIEHVRDPRAVLKWAKQRLVPSGTLLMTTPRAGGMSSRAMGRQWFHYTREHLWYFSPRSIGILLKQLGFKDIRLQSASKSITVEYALAHFSRGTSYNKMFSPPARILRKLLPEWIKRFQIRYYLGEMVITARS
jgi:2-polyprenyl-3-methyl-5-hydroxy-6-metoxy-1,4-benzoquinol methylase